MCVKPVATLIKFVGVGWVVLGIYACTKVVAKNPANDTVVGMVV
jgi:hypothetical protein